MDGYLQEPPLRCTFIDLCSTSVSVSVSKTKSLFQHFSPWQSNSLKKRISTKKQIQRLKIAACAGNCQSERETYLRLTRSLYQYCAEEKQLVRAKRKQNNQQSESRRVTSERTRKLLVNEIFQEPLHVSFSSFFRFVTFAARRETLPLIRRPLQTCPRAQGGPRRNRSDPSVRH